MSDKRTNSASMSTVRLGDIAYARSGDKGVNANVGVAAYTEHGYELLRDQLTAERVQDFFAATAVSRVERYELPNLHAFNFLLYGILTDYLRIDAQGKTLGQALLELPIRIDATQRLSCLPPDPIS